MTNLSLFDLSGKKALVTGGAMGIGRACATALAMGGADVAIADLNENVGKKTAAMLRELGVNTCFVRCDVSDKSQVEDMVARIVEQFGRLDIAVNNAGIGIGGTEDESYPKNDWDKTLAVNLTGVWLCAQAQAQQMIKQSPTEGKIINLASIAGTSAMPMSNSVYASSKAGVIQMTKQLAIQWGRFNINVNSLSPSYVLTPLMAEGTPEVLQRIRELTPMGHVQRPEDLYGPVMYLASNASNYMTGQNLIVDGGYSLGAWKENCPTRVVTPRVSIKEEGSHLSDDIEAMGTTQEASK